MTEVQTCALPICAMYRAVTLYCLENGLIKDGKVDAAALEQKINDIHIEFRLNEDGVPQTYLNGVNVERQIRTMEVSSFVSPVAALGFVREALVREQQKMGEKKGIVMDGRDIGTVVFPNAELKIFVTASPEVRAERRVKELEAKGDPVSFEEVLKNVEERDHIDQTREISPLKKADDAVVLDNSDMTREEQNEWLMDEFEKAVASH